MSYLLICLLFHFSPLQFICSSGPLQNILFIFLFYCMYTEANQMMQKKSYKLDTVCGTKGKKTDSMEKNAL